MRIYFGKDFSNLPAPKLRQAGEKQLKKGNNKIILLNSNSFLTFQPLFKHSKIGNFYPYNNYVDKAFHFWHKKIGKSMAPGGVITSSGSTMAKILGM
ncbi:MAG: hypothetical protein Sapg2KO_20160 [Saprospiraceae bacterium]